jgi:tetratricopeptide (TPR) repeat protein
LAGPVLALLLLGALCGCKSIRSVRLTPGEPLALTAREAGEARRQGLALYGQQPRSLVRVTNAARLLEQAARALGNEYDPQWQAARTLAFLAENEPRVDFRREAARRGIAFARRARDLKPDGVEGCYWYALNVGLLADADRGYGLDAVGEMESALKHAVELDERHDWAGPLRVLGILHLRTPAPPASIGSPRKALRLLQRAAELFPDYPENQLYLAEALRDSDRVAEAEGALRRVLDAPPWPDCTFESARWKTAARTMLENLDNR